MESTSADSHWDFDRQPTPDIVDMKRVDDRSFNRETSIQMNERQDRKERLCPKGWCCLGYNLCFANTMK